MDRCYRPEPFPSDRHRVEYFCTRSLPLGSAFGCPKAFGLASRRSHRLGFGLYEKITAPLVAAAKPKTEGGTVSLHRLATRQG
ncbi:MAG: hypothetical protein ABSH14_11630 [Verrucomicrobiia bacterium]